MKKTHGWCVYNFNLSWKCNPLAAPFSQDASGTVDVAALFDHVNEKAPDSYWKRIAKEMLDPLNTANTASYNFTDSKNLSFLSVVFCILLF